MLADNWVLLLKFDAKETWLGCGLTNLPNKADLQLDS